MLNIHSPWGQRSGGHLNPATTLTFLRLGKVRPLDAGFYTLSQFAGGVLGTLVAAQVEAEFIAHPNVNYVVTVPGTRGAGVAFAAEVIITFILMSVVLRASNSVKLSRFTGLFAGTLVAAFISFEAPFSGMSMNPARSFGSALPAQAWTAFWIYFTAPPLGMFLAAELYVRLRGTKSVYCAKIHHHNNKRCIFRCNFDELVKPCAAAARRRGQNFQ
jgi:aquaporin Z